jgi:O-succinylbenzoic acid--CoA ligase
VNAGFPLYTTYGMTEAASQIATTRPGDHNQQVRRSAPLLIPGSVRISDDGEVLLNGPTRFRGYLRPDGVERPFDAEGWFAAGDLGAFDEEGRLRVFGRKDNRFASGGENICPEEIERALLDIAGVAQALVVPLPDADWGARPVAFIDSPNLNVEREADAESIRRQLRERLPGFKVPRQFFLWPGDLEKGMKPNRRAFAARARAAAGPAMPQEG